MKKYPVISGLRMGAAILILSFGLSAYAEPPRDELVHAYRLLAVSDADYAGHRVAAMEEVRAAGRELGLRLEGDLSEHDRQWKSDERMSEARRLVRDAKKTMEQRDRDRVAAHLDKALKEINTALSVH